MALSQKQINWLFFLNALLLTGCAVIFWLRGEIEIAAKAAVGGTLNFAFVGWRVLRPRPKNC